MSPPIHVAASTCRNPTRMAALDFSASPVNTAETLKRTSDLSLEGMRNKKKIALLGSTVRPAKVIICEMCESSVSVTLCLHR